MNDKPESRVWRQGQPDDDPRFTRYALTEKTLEQALTTIREYTEDKGERLSITPTQVLARGEELHRQWSKARRGKSQVVKALEGYGVDVINVMPEPWIRGTHADFLLWDDHAFLERRAEGWRPICPKRARKLRRRGEDVRYLPEYGSNAWIPPHLQEEH